MDLSLLLTGLGAVLVAICQVDLFFTVLQYQGHGLFSRWLYRGTWALATAIAGVLPGRQRPRLLAMLGPMMVVASLALWILLAIIGFALIYYPHFTENFSLKPGVEAGLLDAIYASGVALSTVGFGDVTPITPVFQLLTVFESLLGFSILTLSISYILGIYGVVSLQGELGASIRDRVGAADDPLRLARSYAAQGAGGMESSLAALHGNLLRYHEGLLRYPVVYYFHTGHEFRSMPYVFGMVGGAAAALRWGLPRGHPLRSSAALEMLLRGFRRVVGDISGRFGARSVLDEPWIGVGSTPPSGEQREALLRRRFARLERGLAAVTPCECRHDDARRRYRAWRAFSEEIRGFVRTAAADLGYREEQFAREAPGDDEVGRA